MCLSFTDLSQSYTVRSVCDIYYFYPLHLFSSDISYLNWRFVLSTGFCLAVTSCWLAFSATWKTTNILCISLIYQWEECVYILKCIYLCTNICMIRIHSTNPVGFRLVIYSTGDCMIEVSSLRKIYGTLTIFMANWKNSVREKME